MILKGNIGIFLLFGITIAGIRSSSFKNSRMRRKVDKRSVYRENCTTDSECNAKVGLVCSQINNKCECLSPWFWSEYDGRCATCSNDWTFINYNCISPLILANNSEDAYNKCRELNSYQVNLLDSQDYSTFVAMNIAPFPGIYLDLFYNPTKNVYQWGYGDILSYNSSLWCSNTIFNRYKCAIFRTGVGFNCLFTGQCNPSFIKYSTICEANPLFYLNSTKLSTTTKNSTLALITTTPIKIATYGKFCISDSDCQAYIGLKCQNNKCLCQNPWFPSYSNQRCISCPANWTFINEYCHSPVIFMTNATQDVCKQLYNSFQISILNQEDYNTYVSLNIAPFGIYVDFFFDPATSQQIWGNNRVLSNASSMWCPNMQLFDFKCAAFKTGNGFNCLMTARCKTDFRTICKRDPLFS